MPISRNHLMVEINVCLSIIWISSNGHIFPKVSNSGLLDCRVFEVRCMHIPIYDRTPFEGLYLYISSLYLFLP